jgi:hypothetical protein
MPAIDYGLSSYARPRGDLPELPVINMFAEEAPTEDRGIVLISRPGLDDREVDLGNGPVDCLFKRDLVIGSGLFGVSDTRLYEDGVLVGTVDGAGPFSMAGYEEFLFAAGGSSLWGYDGTTLAAIATPDSFDVAKVIVAASRAVVISKDTGQFFWSDPLEDDIEALDFATAENQPDRLLDMVFIDDTLVLGGAETIEFWPNTGDAENPFQPLEGRVIEKGVKATGCMVPFGSTFAAVTNGNQVILGNEDNIISNPGLEEKIEASAECALWTFQIGGIEFLALRIDNETQVWSWRSKLWSEFASYGEDNFIPQCFAGGVFGSSVDGRTMEWSTGHEDLGSVLERRFRGGFRSKESAIVSSLVVECEVGQTPFLEGDYVNPVVELFVSLNHGKTWRTAPTRPLGAQGEWNTALQWNALGMTRRGKGWIGEFRVTAPVSWRVSAVSVNDPLAGR